MRGKVLYVEDVDVNFVLVESGLERFSGVQLIRATTGLDGVRMVRSERPDFVLLDMHLPDISGLEVVRQLSEDIALQRLRVTVTRRISGSRSSPPPGEGSERLKTTQ